jgi:hypothetical protein
MSPQSLFDGGTVMKWEPPVFLELKMDAEIGAYQDDFENIPDVTEDMTPPGTQINDTASQSQ